MAARFVGPTRPGQQAGALRALDRRVRVLEDENSGVQYVGHTGVGTASVTSGTVTWTFEWLAPIEGGDPVVFHLAANASNDDDSELGDIVLLRRLFAQAGP